MRRPILNFLPLVLRVLLNSTPDSVPQSTGVNKTLLKEILELVSKEGSFRCLVSTLVLVQGRQNCISTVEANGNDGIY